MSILFCTPCYGNHVTEPHHSSMIALVSAMLSQPIDDQGNTVDFGIQTLGNESLITRARNVCAAEFLASRFERLMFIDADIEFQPEDVAKLWSMDAPIAVGVYRMKRPGSKYAAWRDGELVEDLDQFERPITVDYAGTGFMMIKREVFETLQTENPDWEYEEGQIGKCWAFFQDPFIEGFHMSEDYFFCHSWREHGGEVWMDPTVRLIHHGTYGYGLQQNGTE